MSRSGACENPWSRGCKNADTHLFIKVNGRVRRICGKCWKAIAGDDEITW